MHESFHFHRDLESSYAIRFVMSQVFWSYICSVQTNRPLSKLWQELIAINIVTVTGVFNPYDHPPSDLLHSIHPPPPPSPS
jgi:hypothetical protein